MIVGIRGTSGWVSVEGDHESMIVSDGHVHIVGENPVTGEQKEIEVFSGQRISTYLYNDREVDSIMFYLEQVTERDLPEFMLERLRENPELLDKVCKETGWDKPWILGIEMSGITPTPTPTKAPDKNANKGEDEITPTVTPTATPTPTNVPEQDDLEALLALMTPTPTPTPTHVPVQVDDDDDDEDEEEVVPQASPQPSGNQNRTPVQYFSTNITGLTSYGDTNKFVGRSYTEIENTNEYPFKSNDGKYNITNPTPLKIDVDTADVNIQLPMRIYFDCNVSTGANPAGRVGKDITSVDNVTFSSGGTGHVVERIGGNTDLVKNADAINGTTYSYGDSADMYSTKTVSNGVIVLSNPVDNNSPTSVSINQSDGNVTVTP